MIGIHIVHRRLAQLTEKAEKVGFDRLTDRELMDFRHCLLTNAKLVREMDRLKDLALAAQIGGDMEWLHEICRKIDELEARLI